MEASLPALDLSEWESPRFPFYDFDLEMEERAAIALCDEPRRLPAFALEVLTRCQRLTGRRNAASRTPIFDRALERHRSLHDLTQPLVRADWAHALDVWQWCLRLEPEASLAVQLAAMFHDVERLEAGERSEGERASEYQRFKDRHARRGAEIAGPILEAAGVDAATREQVMQLISDHEGDSSLLGDADALSFFSLNSPGYLDYFGPEAARRKIAWTLARLRPQARRRLDSIRLRPDVATLVEAVR